MISNIRLQKTYEHCGSHFTVMTTVTQLKTANTHRVEVPAG